jgi:hypothetical protein
MYEATWPLGKVSPSSGTIHNQSLVTAAYGVRYSYTAFQPMAVIVCSIVVPEIRPRMSSLSPAIVEHHLCTKKV